MKIIYMKCIFVKAASVLKTSEGMLTIVVCNPKEGALEAAAAKKAGGNDPKASKPEAKKSNASSSLSFTTTTNRNRFLFLFILDFVHICRFVNVDLSFPLAGSFLFLSGCFALLAVSVDGFCSRESFSRPLMKTFPFHFRFSFELRWTNSVSFFLVSIIDSFTLWSSINFGWFLFN